MSNKVLIEATPLLTTIRDWANGRFALQIATADAFGGIKSSTTAGNVQVDGSTGIATISDASGSGAGAKGLMTAAQAVKLEGIATGAQVNVLEGITVDGTPQTITNKIAALDLSAYAKKTDIAAALNFKGSATGDAIAAMTTATASNGDVYECSADNTGATVTFHEGYEYAAVISGDPATLTWVELGSYIDLSGYVQNTREINGHALSADITLNGADLNVTGYSITGVSGDVAATDTVNGAIAKVEVKANANATAIGVLNGDATTAGSVAKAIADAVADLDYTDSVSGDYVTSVSEADGVISVTKGTKGSVTSGETALVDGGTVYTAIDGAVKVDTITVNGTTQALTSKTLPFATGTTNGTIKVNGVEVAVAGLGSNAYTSTAFVPQTTTINAKALSTNIVLDGSDIALTGYTEASAASAIAATDTVNQAIGKLEYKIDNATTGTVTSVGLSMPDIFSVSGSPVTTSGTLTASLATQSANKVFAGPVSGSAAAPTFRSLVVADISDLEFMTAEQALAILNNTSSST